MAALPFLERIAVTGTPAGTSFLAGAGNMTATTTRIYILTRVSSVYSVSAFNLAGAYQEADSFTIAAPASSNYRGMTVIGTNIYLLNQYSSPRYNSREREFFSGNILVYSLQTGAAQTGFTLAGGHYRPTGLVFVNNQFKIIGQTLNSRRQFENKVLIYNDRGVAQSPMDFDVSPVSVYGLAATDDRIYMAYFARPAVLRGYTHDFGRVTADDTAYEGSDISRGGIGWTGRAIVSGSGRSLWFYGMGAPTPEPPAPPPDIRTPGRIGFPRGPIQQYTGFQEYEQRFDVLRLEANQSVTVVALNVPGVQQTATQFVEVASPVTIQNQLREISWVPRQTIPALEIGDTVLLHQGLGVDQITTIPPDADLTVTGIIQHGGITQWVNLSGPAPPTPDAPSEGNG